MRKETIIDTIFWIIVGLVIFFLAWKIIGGRPTLEQISMVFTLFFLGLAWENRKDTKNIIGSMTILNKNNNLTLEKLDKLNKLDEISDSLKKLVKLEENSVKGG